MRPAAALSTFYVICQPGFEQELILELQELWPFLIDVDSRPQTQALQILSVEPGGVLIQATVIAGYQINIFSKIAGRVLLRLDEFRVRDFPKMHEKLKRIPLANWLGKEKFHLSVAAGKSRLNHEKRIADVAKSIWPQIIADDIGAESSAVATLHIRMHDDICSVSLDTSGEHLHFRQAGQSKKWMGTAPLRETSAAFMMRKMIEGFSLYDLQKICLWDPMMGSGTLLQEARDLYQPQWARVHAGAFSFLHFKNAPKILASPSVEGNFPAFKKLFVEVIGSDIDEKMIASAEHNFGQDQHTRLFAADFLSGWHEAMSDLWIVLNPPYGERMALPGGFVALGKALSETTAQRIGVLTPQKETATLAAHLPAFQLVGRWPFKNGGLPVDFSVFEKPIEAIVAAQSKI